MLHALFTLIALILSFVHSQISIIQREYNTFFIGLLVKLCLMVKTMQFNMFVSKDYTIKSHNMYLHILHKLLF